MTVTARSRETIETSESPPIESVATAAYRIPTDAPESDGTLEWNASACVVVHAKSGAQRGFGYTYAPAAAKQFIDELLTDAIVGRSAWGVERCWQAMMRSVRNAGRPGVALCAISAVDVALWDLKARLLEVPLVRLWGVVRAGVPVYGSGGFTSYSDKRIAEQLGGWAAAGIDRVKMKVGRNPGDDPRRVRVARRAVGDDVELFVDANGAYGCKQALELAEVFATESNVRWFEEPRPSDDLEGLRLLRDAGPAGMEIAAGEYGYTLPYFRSMLQAGAVDCLQADATRCGGFTGFFKIAALCEAFNMPLSAHCAPQLHAHLGCSLEPVRHIEYFHDHVRIGELLLDGLLRPELGRLFPDVSRPGLGFVLKESDARRFDVPA